MKNNLKNIFSKILKILTIIFFITLLIIPFKVIAISVDEQGSIDIEQEEIIKVADNNPTNISRENTKLFLFLGNSKTYYNNMPFMFQRFMNSLGKSVVVKEAARAGHRLSDLWNNAGVREELNHEYDYVVLQPKLLSSDNGEKEAAICIVNALKEKNPNIKVIINGIWKSEDDYKLNKKAQKMMNNRFRNLRDTIISECGVETKISYWGQAVLRAHNKNSFSESDLFVDERHPSALSSYLGVASLYTTIYGTEANSDYNGKIKNKNFDSIGEYNLTSWNYQIDRDRWPKDTPAINQAQLMQSIAYQTYVAQYGNPEEEEADDENTNETEEQTDLASLTDRINQENLAIINDDTTTNKTLSVDNSPRISIKNDEDSGNVRVNITDSGGLNPESIKLYTSDGKEIDPKYYTIEAVTDENNKTTKLTYVLKEKFFNGKSKQISVVAKDTNGNYNKTSFNLKPKNNDKDNYSVNPAPRIKEFAIKNNKKITFKVYDKGGISYLKVYDLNQRNKKGKYLLVKQVTNIKGSTKGTKISLNLKDLESIDSDSNTHYYSIKVVAKDVNGRKCKRVINFKVTDN